MLRFDDTDVARSRIEYAESIERDLTWLGIVPAAILRQSDRFALYGAAAQRLKESGRLYPCFETADELDLRRKRMQARGLPPIYDRAALALTDAARARPRRPRDASRIGASFWRPAPSAGRISCAATATSTAPRCPTTVLVREDGSYLYTLPSVVDDIDLGITHVIRGEDHVTNTGPCRSRSSARSVAPFPPSGTTTCSWTCRARGLSKRTGALSLTSLREGGIEPLAVAAMAVLTGSSAAVQPVASLDALGALVDLAHLSRAPARFDENELTALSAKTLHAMAYETAAPRLAERRITGPVAEAFWLAVRGNLDRFDDVAPWWAVVQGPITPVIEGCGAVAAGAGAAAPRIRGPSRHGPPGRPR